MMSSLGFPLDTVAIFFFVIFLSIYFDLYRNRGHQAIALNSAAIWSVFWIVLSLSFYAYLWLRFDQNAASLYITGYVLELSLSIDNLMVFIAVFASFGIKGGLQRKILYWGIIGALVLRAIFVVVGVGLLKVAPWVGFLFALFIFWTAWKMITLDNGSETIADYSEHWSVRLTKKYIPIFPRLVGDKFFIPQAQAKELVGKDESIDFIESAKWIVTPAFLCLIVIEVSDIAFAFDSVPAVIAVTEEPILVYAAMIFAVLGLRSLYFVLSALTQYLVHLEKAVIALLFFIGIKMSLHSWNQVVGDSGIHISTSLSLSIVLGTLLVGIIASLIFPAKGTNE